MSLDVEVLAVRDSLPQLAAMLAVVDACKAARISFPVEVIEYFGDAWITYGPDTPQLREAMERVSVPVSGDLLSDGGVTIRLQDLPPGAKAICIRARYEDADAESDRGADLAETERPALGEVLDMEEPSPDDESDLSGFGDEDTSVSLEADASEEMVDEVADQAAAIDDLNRPPFMNEEDFFEFISQELPESVPDAQMSGDQSLDDEQRGIMTDADKDDLALVDDDEAKEFGFMTKRGRFWDDEALSGDDDLDTGLSTEDVLTEEDLMAFGDDTGTREVDELIDQSSDTSPDEATRSADDEELRFVTEDDLLEFDDDNISANDEEIPPPLRTTFDEGDGSDKHEIDSPRVYRVEQSDAQKDEELDESFDDDLLDLDDLDVPVVDDLDEAVDDEAIEPAPQPPRLPASSSEEMDDLVLAVEDDLLDLGDIDPSDHRAPPKDQEFLSNRRPGPGKSTDLEFLRQEEHSRQRPSTNAKKNRRPRLDD